jgi:hypothetical protein
LLLPDNIDGALGKSWPRRNQISFARVIWSTGDAKTATRELGEKLFTPKWKMR